MKTENANQLQKTATKRGRPKNLDKLQNVIEVAKKQFLTHGFVAVSMDAIAAASNVSKMTLYSYFPNKEALFESVVGNRIQQMCLALNAEESLITDAHGFKNWLSQVATQFMLLIRDPEVIDVYRIIFAGAQTHKTMCEVFYQQGCLTVSSTIKHGFDTAFSLGLLKSNNTLQITDQLLALLMGRVHTLTMLGLETPTHEQNKEIVDAAVDLILKGYMQQT